MDRGAPVDRGESVSILADDDVLRPGQTPSTYDDGLVPAKGANPADTSPPEMNAAERRRQDVASEATFASPGAELRRTNGVTAGEVMSWFSSTSNTCANVSDRADIDATVNHSPPHTG